MIESEEKKRQLTDMVTRWCNHTKILSQLREYDIPNLVGQILDEFYHIHLSCGHLVSEFNEAVYLIWDDVDGEISSVYCKDCAEGYKRELGAREVKDET